jgi:hypothetical protein
MKLLKAFLKALLMMLTAFVIIIGLVLLVCLSNHHPNIAGIVLIITLAIITGGIYISE